MDNKMEAGGIEENAGDGAVHAMGNGRMLVYGCGADMEAVYGPPYSSPSLTSGSWSLADGGWIGYTSERENGTAIWRHTMRGISRTLGYCEQFMASSADTFWNRVELEVEAALTLCVADGTACRIGDWSGQGETNSQALLVTPDTARVFIYPSGRSHYVILSCQGPGYRGIELRDGKLTLSFGPGTATFSMSGGIDYAEAVAAHRQTYRSGYAEQIAAARLDGHRFAKRLTLPDNKRGLPIPFYNAIKQLCENTAFLIAAQQSLDGGIMAGHRYPLAYIRDQYGACRGLLALGLYDEAKRNLQYRYEKWLMFGSLKNAESMGHDRIRHIHENDDVEITSYTVLQALDYADAVQDDTILREWFPMLEWCLHAPLAHLREGMLPFNGDETYVAGGFLPRSALNDGSMEATLLFLEAGKRMLPYIRKLGLWSDEEADRYDNALLKTEQAFRANFLGDEGFAANQPSRRDLPGMPEIRRGVCERCIAIGWTQRKPEGAYVCPSCWTEPSPLRAPAPAMEVLSAALLPTFIGSRILTAEEQRIGVSRAGELFEKHGYLPTVPGARQHRWVGYDAGLLLFGLTAFKYAAADDVCKHVVQTADSTGAWVEYYEAGAPQGCRCRPWESGMNIAALIGYVSQ